jgi:hypothetical protein
MATEMATAMRARFSIAPQETESRGTGSHPPG